MSTVAFIGAGPGAADLITLRGARLLGQADVVLADALTDPALRALAPQARWLQVGKRGFGQATAQDVIHALLLRHAACSELVVRLKGGDPSIFGRLEEELAVVRAAGHTTVVVPGVTAALAAAADAQQPLTRRGRGRSVALTTAMTREQRLQGARHADSEVFYMAGRQLPQLARQLRQAGWSDDTPVLVVSRAGWPDALSTRHRLDTLPHASVVHAGRPTVVIVGVAAAQDSTSFSPTQVSSTDSRERTSATGAH
ncbi:MAG: uroporphyrinogen-III C-methyltransferase [Tepidimonas sp.]|uniref:uroporphyrinogen-III C-methyltransferase n=1 Tax=Tepidimonas sp. TaxID=2002775 RepID=UPI00298F1704|nr:uroporphyrinogen-III C-methyltransferase [Tepidimonas sp.]MCS6811361.1 uroporphyrinogen-III C-methyltransferase [Tepidimonas sp.]MDW8337304.1 uroporphyrinogen-III C-methyltransferase [Tepidimonas sp.]